MGRSSPAREDEAVSRIGVSTQTEKDQTGCGLTRSNILGHCDGDCYRHCGLRDVNGRRNASEAVKR
jgi:hypothetical protein